MSDLRGIILTIPEIENARKEYGLKPSFSNARLREYMAVMEAQHKKSYKLIMVKVCEMLRDVVDKCEANP